MSTTRQRGRKAPDRSAFADALALVLGSDPVLRKACAHPLRVRILRVFQEAENPVSPIMLAETLRVPLGNVAYHVRVLAELKVIRCTVKRQRRGALEHFYVLDHDGSS